MAVSRKERTIRLTAVNDVVEGPLLVSQVAVSCATAGGQVRLADAAGFVHIGLAVTQHAMAVRYFNPPLAMDGLVVAELDASLPAVFVYIA